MQGVAVPEAFAALVVDDDESLLATTAAVLEGAFEVMTSSSAAEALAIVSRRRVDVVISDLHLHGMDGLALLAQLRRRAVPPGLLLVTGDPDGAQRAKEEGAGVAVLSKPVSPVQLLRTARRLAEQAAAARAKARPPR